MAEVAAAEETAVPAAQVRDASAEDGEPGRSASPASAEVSQEASPGIKHSAKPVLDVDASAPENLEDFFDNVMFTPSNGVKTPTPRQGPAGPGLPPWGTASPYPMDPAMMTMMYYHNPYMAGGMPMYYIPVQPPPPPPPPKGKHQGHKADKGAPEFAGQESVGRPNRRITPPPPPPPSSRHPETQARKNEPGEDDEAAQSPPEGPPASGLEAHDQEHALRNDGQAAVDEGGTEAMQSITTPVPLHPPRAASAPARDVRPLLTEQQDGSSLARRTQQEKPNSLSPSSSVSQTRAKQPPPVVFEESAFPALPGSNTTSAAGSAMSTPTSAVPGSKQSPTWEGATVPAAANQGVWGKGPAPAVTQAPAPPPKHTPTASEVAPTARKVANPTPLPRKPEAAQAMQAPQVAPPQDPASAIPSPPATPPQGEKGVFKERLTVAGVQYTWPTESPASSMTRFTSAGKAPQQNTVSSSENDLVIEKDLVEIPEPVSSGSNGFSEHPESTAATTAEPDSAIAEITKKATKKKKSKKKKQAADDDDDEWTAVTRGRRNR